MTSTSQLTAKTPLESLVLHYPESVSVLERHHLDFCCKGDRSLLEALDHNQSAAERIIQEIEQNMKETDKERIRRHVDLAKISASQLVNWIVDRYHRTLRDDLPTIKQLTGKVARVHEKNHPELKKLEGVVLPIADALLCHIDHEEQRLFRLVHEASNGGDVSQLHVDIKKELDTL
eukprot:CAMPEP_0117456302 /NCGR_PEP_ID=MMETSP0759-20121206/11806_1 /TAXON_ID=63605 /ORGANISM="Percolomonas cosmopolitus, Strain WS" /LENGTH=175 /DNA_ID=CAMNT_0005249635 /DNA_START=72 /DNA_END=599 /DNA_ORIENTATION=-